MMLATLDHWRGLLGVVVILGIAVAMSENRRAISLRMVVCGLAMQVVLGLLLLRVAAGRHLLDAASRWVETVLACADAGSRFVFGDALVDPSGPADFVFAFRVLPAIVFVAALFAVLYHLGIMQVVVKAFAWVTTRVLGSSGAETLNNAASIFLGQTEAPLVIRPYLAGLTRSELAVVMVGGMGLVSGGVLGAYIAAGCAPGDLLTAILMSFPATIYLTKIFIPETGTPEPMGSLDVVGDHRDVNLLAAAARGTRERLLLAANIGSILISFIALVTLLNLLLAWLGGLRDQLDPRSFTLATIAMCSFANISSMGIQLGGIGSLVPDRRSEIAQLGLKVLLIATLANFLSAAIAGLLL